MKAAGKLRQRPAFGHELRAELRREDFQDQLLTEADDEIGAGRKHVRRADIETVAARDVERNSQPLPWIRAKGEKAVRIGEVR